LKKEIKGSSETPEDFYQTTLLSSKRKGKVHPRTDLEGPEGELMHSSTIPSTSALDGGGWSTPNPGRFTTKKDRYPLYRRLGGP